MPKIQPLQVKFQGVVKGGFTVELGGVMAFLPGSLIDIRPVKDLESLEQQSLEFKIVKIDKKRNNVVCFKARSD